MHIDKFEGRLIRTSLRLHVAYAVHIVETLAKVYIERSLQADFYSVEQAFEHVDLKIGFIRANAPMKLSRRMQGVWLPDLVFASLLRFDLYGVYHRKIFFFHKRVAERVTPSTKMSLGNYEFDTPELLETITSVKRAELVNLTDRRLSRPSADN
jgi:hypothetical protein